MPVLVSGEILQPYGRFAAMFDFAIGKADLAGLVMKVERLEVVPGKVFKPTVEQSDGIARNEARLRPLHDKRDVNNGQTFGQIAVMRQGATAIANREEGRNEFKAVILTSLFDLVEAAKVIGRLFAESI